MPSMAELAEIWMATRPGLRPRTVELYNSLLKQHILAELGPVELAKLTPARVRSWHAGLLGRGRPGAVTVAKCYRLLKSILSTAVEDGLIERNPCGIKGASVEHSAERPVATLVEVARLADVIGDRWRLMVLLATFCGLRLGELAGLTRARIDLEHATVSVVLQLQELADGSYHVGPPKSAAGRRTITIPPHVRPEIRAHLDRFVGPAPDCLVFTSPDGGPIRRSNFRNRVWLPACAAARISTHFHDLRHTGNTLAAATGASTKELMARMGHTSPRAALIYQHATAERDVAIAQ